MPSPFPGMDPFLQSQEWEDFHTRLMTALSDHLSPTIEPNYLVRVKRRVYLESVGGEPESMRRTDIAIVTVDARPASGLLSPHAARMTAECELPMPIERQVMPMPPCRFRKCSTSSTSVLATTSRSDTLLRSIHLSPRKSCAGFNRLQIMPELAVARV